MNPPIFPIVRSGVLQRLEEICGTGFFISSAGHFFTCAHLFEERPSATYSAALAPGDLTRLTPMVLLAKVIGLDLAMGQIVGAGCSAPATLARRLPPADTPTEAIGFVGGTFREPDGSIKFDNRQLERTTDRFIGYSENYKIGAGAPFEAKSFPAVLTSSGLIGGYSGGPLLDQQQKVIGLLSNTSSDPALMAKFNDGRPFQVSVCADALWRVLQERVPALAKELWQETGPTS